MYGTNQQLYVWADWKGCPPRATDTYAFPFCSRSWTLSDGQTLECQADLVSISQTATNQAMVWVGIGSDFYAFNQTQRTVYLEKWTANYGLSVFWLDSTVRLPAADVVLCLALTRDQANLILTTRVPDKNKMVLFERGFAETPQAESSVTTEQFRALTGITTISPVPDPGPPILSGKETGVAVFQFTDGNQPPVQAIFDNVSLRIHDLPRIGIARAAWISWPDVGSYSVERASTVEGPWCPVPNPAMPGMRQTTVSASDHMEVFRLRQAP